MTTIILSTLLAFFVIGYFHQYNLRHKAQKKLKKVKEDLRIPYDDYSRHQKNSIVFYRYLADIRKSEPKGCLELINQILDKYDNLLFDQEI